MRQLDAQGDLLMPAVQAYYVAVPQLRTREMRMPVSEWHTICDELRRLRRAQRRAIEAANIWRPLILLRIITRPDADANTAP